MLTCIFETRAQKCRGAEACKDWCAGHDGCRTHTPDARVCGCLQTKWHSQSAMAAAEERERRIAVLQQEVDSLKARLWDSAARIGDLEKCAEDDALSTLPAVN